MDLLKKVETLLGAKTRSILPRRNRRSILDEQEEELLLEMRKALGEVEAKERDLAQQIEVEEREAHQAAQRGDRPNQQAHERRAVELESYLREESTFAINLEEKLAALEEKLALAKDAVEKEARNVAARDKKAEDILAHGLDTSSIDLDDFDISVRDDDIISDDFIDDDPEVAARKSRLSG